MRPNNNITTYKLLAVFVLLAATAFFFYQAIEFKLVWDDVTYLILNKNYHEPGFLIDNFSSSFILSNSYYRPLVTYWIYYEAYYSDLNLSLMHFNSLVIHCFNTTVVFFIAYNIFNNEKNSQQLYSVLASFSLALFFSLNPIVIEPVVWISGRFDLLMTSFLLVALLIDVTLNNYYRVIGIGFCFFGAALCKEMAVSFALIIPFWHLIINNKKIIINFSTLKYFYRCLYIKIYMSIFLFGILYLILRLNALEQNALFKSGSFDLERTFLILKSIGLYVKILIFPFLDLSPTHYHKLPIPFNDITSWITIVGLLFILTLWFYQKKLRSLCYLFTAILLSISPVIHLLPMTIKDNIVHSRFLLFPLVLLLLMSFTLVIRYHHLLSKRMKAIGSLVFFFFFAINGFNTFVTIPLWKDNLTLWSWGIKADPNSTLAKENYAAALVNAHHYDLALEYIKSSIKTSPSSIMYQLLGDVILHKGKFKLSEQYYTKALNFKISKTNYATLLVQLATVKISLDDLEDVELLLNRAILIMPHLHRAYYIYYEYYSRLGNNIKAEKYLLIAIKYSHEPLKKQYSNLMSVVDL